MPEPRPIGSPLRSSPEVSVIVPVRDDPERIRELIQRLSAQTLSRERFEVVIGDDGSEPGSLAGIETRDGWIRLTSGPAQTSYAARNRAAAAARGGVLAFCDSDCLPEPGWLEAGLSALAAADVVGGAIRYAPPPRPTAWSLLSIDMYLDQQNNVRLSRGVTANLFVGLGLFLELGGFDESLPSGGDYDFVRRAVGAGARLVYAPDAAVSHPTIDERQSFLRKVRRTNRSATARRARSGQHPGWRDIATFIPVYGVVSARRQALRRPFQLQPHRFAAAGIAPGRSAELRALALLYLVVGYVAALARTSGWLDGRRLARLPTPATPTSGSPPEAVIASRTDASS